MSVWGVARELGASLDQKLLPHEVDLVEDQSLKTEDRIEVAIEDPSCTRYMVRLLTGVDLNRFQTPGKIKERLEQYGMRTINLVADITNYVLLETGAPLHAFDYDQIQGAKLIVRRARAGEKLTTLDHVERYLTPEDLVIADSQKPLALAGIMGGESSEVTEKSQSILLEGAYFEAATVRRSSRRHELVTEGSKRWERGGDIGAVESALKLAAALIQQITGCKVAKGVLKARESPPAERVISLRLSQVRRLLGISLGASEVEAILSRLGFKSKGVDSDRLLLVVPSFRTDVKEEIDLVEEVGRLYGYNNLYTKGELPRSRGSRLGHTPLFSLQGRVREALLREGLQEFLSCDLVGEELSRMALTDALPARALIKVLNPHSQAQSVMRPSLLPAHLSIVKGNLAHGIDSIAAFEVGRIHFKEKDSYREPTALAITLSGKRSHSHFDSLKSPSGSEEVDLLDLKGIVENLLQALKCKADFLPSHLSSMHPFQQAKIVIDGQEIGIMGQVHPALLQEAGILQPLFFAELFIEPLAGYIPSDLKMKPLALFPSSKRDWTLTVKEELEVGEIFKAVERARGPLLESFELLAVFRGDKIAKGWKNVTLRFVFRSSSETLSHDSVDQEMAALVRQVSESLEQKVMK